MLEGNTEPADERRATAFGLLAQPAMVLEMLLRHAHDGTQPASRPPSPTPTPEAGRRTRHHHTRRSRARNQVTAKRKTRTRRTTRPRLTAPAQ